MPVSQKIALLSNRLSLPALLFAAIFVTYAYFYSGGGHNEAARFDTIRALLDEGRFSVDSFAYNSGDLIFIDGKFYSSKAPGTVYMGLPLFWASDRLLRLLPISESARYHWVTWLTSIFSIALSTALLALLILWLSIRHGASEKEALLVTLALSLGTMVFPFATLFFSHTAAAAFIFLAYYQIYVFLHEAPGPSASYHPSEDPNAVRGSAALWRVPWRLALAGASMGFAIVLEYPAAIAVVFLHLYLLAHWVRLRAPMQAWFWVPAWTVMGLLPLFAYNWASFGDPLFISYEAYKMEGNEIFDAPQKGILGIRIPFLEPSYWPTFFSNLKNITIDPLRGLFYLNPILLLALPGLAILSIGWKCATWSQKSDILLVFVMFTSYLAFNSGYGDSIAYWGGGASFGPRHLMVAIPFLALPLLAALRNRRLGRVWTPLLALSVFFCLMAAAIEPRTPYEPANPILSYYLPHFAQSEFALNKDGVFTNEPLIGTSVAFNWGKLLHLPGPLQLVPLYLIWLLAAMGIDRRIGTGRAFQVAIGLFVAILLTIQLVGAALG